MKSVDVSVLLCTYNRAGILKQVLQSVVDQDLKGGRFAYEIVVVDNDSTDNTKQVVQEFADHSEIPIRYCHEPSQGIAQARNRSVEEGRGEWFAFIDDDEFADPGWLRELFNSARKTNAEIVGGAVRLDLPADKLANLGRETRRSLRERDSGRFGDQVAPCRTGVNPGTDNLLVSRTVFESVGGFDETMVSGGSDSELLMRARRAGYQPWFAPEAIVYHRVPDERLDPRYVKRDSFRSGVMLAFLTQRFHGSVRVMTETIARVGQGVLVTLPMLAIALIRGDLADALDRKIKWWRLLGFLRCVVASFCPQRNRDHSYLDRLNFRLTRPKIPVVDDDQPS